MFRFFYTTFLTVGIFLLFSCGAKDSDTEKKDMHPLSKGAELLFKNTNSKLSNAEKNEIFELTGFILSGDKEYSFAMDTTEEGIKHAFASYVYPTDLNHDGVEEIFIGYGGGMYTSGATGQSIYLFIKNKGGKYFANMDFPGLVPEAITNGYPDLIIPGRGFEFPVWRWNGKEYQFHRKISEEALSNGNINGNIIDIGWISEKYQSIKHKVVKNDIGDTED